MYQLCDNLNSFSVPNSTYSNLRLSNLCREFGFLKSLVWSAGDTVSRERVSYRLCDNSNSFCPKFYVQ